MYANVSLQFSESYVCALKANTTLSFRTLSDCIHRSAPPPGLLSLSRLLPVYLDKKLSANLGGRRLLPFMFLPHYDQALPHRKEWWMNHPTAKIQLGTMWLRNLLARL